MTNKQKTKRELIQELDILRQRVAALEQSELAYKRAEEALREATLRQNEAGKAANVGLWDWDLVTNKVHYSAEWKRQIGYAEHEISDNIEEWRSRVHPDDLESTLERVQRSIAETQQYHNVEFRFRHKDGSYRWILAHASVLQDETGRPIRMLGSHVDISERKRSEDIVRESELKLRRVVETAEEGIVIVQGERIVFANPYALRLFGASMEHVAAMHYLDFTHPDDRGLILDRYKRRAAGEPVSEYATYRLVDGQNRILWVEGHATLFDWEGRPATLVFLTNITERKRVEEALRESEEKLRLLFDEAPVGYHEVDTEGRVIRINRTELDLLGYSHEDVIGQPIWKLCFDEQEVINAFKNKIAGKEPRGRAFERSYRRKNGTPLPVLSEDRILTDQDGRITGIRSTIQDITERKRAEEALRRSEKEATRLARENAVLAEIGRIISSTLNIEEVYKSFAEKVRELIPFDRIAIGLINTDENAMSFPYTEGLFIPGREPGDLGPLAGSTAEKMLETRAGMIIEMGSEEEIAARVPALLPDFRCGIRSALTVPLISGDRVIGTLALRSTIHGIYTERDLKLIESIGNQIAGAIANAQLYGRLKETEESFRRSEGKFRDLFDSAPVGYHEFDMEGRITNVNRTDQEMLGYSREEMIGEFVWKFILEEDIAHREILEKLAGLRPPGQSFEHTYRRKDGRTLPVLFQTRLNKDDQGRIIGMKVTIQDITEQKRTEEALRESKARYDELVRRIPVGVFTLRIRTDGSMVFEYVSPQVCRISGLDADALMHDANLAFTVAHSLDRDDLIRITREAGASLNPFRWEGRFGIRDETRWVRIESNPTPLLNGDTLWNGVIIDITERKRAEEALQFSRQRLELLVQQTPLAVIEWDISGRVLEWNPAAEQMFGFSREEALGQHWTFIAPEAIRERLEGVWESIVEQRRGSRSTNKNRTKDGQTIRCEWFSTPLIDPSGSTVGVASLVMDVTEQTRAEEEKAKLEAQLFQAQKMESVGRLAGGVAHDFNNKLGVIMGYAEMALSQVAPGEKLHRQLGQILESARRSADLTRQLLAFARKQTVSPKVLDLNDTVSGMLKMLRRLIGEDIDLVWNPGANLWKLKVDPSQVDQVLANLAVNARDAISTTGSVTLKTENIVLDDLYCADHPGCIPGEYVLLKMRDTGSGMSKEVLDHIFEPFFTTKGLGKGTGLGLSTVYGIVKQNDGFIEVSSEPGKGTIFKIYLPRFEGETIQSIEETEETPEGTETIVLVEDDEPFLNLSKTILENLGYTVFAERTPEQAIRFIETYDRNIHLLITDVVMPEINGRELAERITAIKPGLKCLYISGYTADVIAQQGVLNEGVHFIQKPFKRSEIAKKVREVLDAHS